MKNQIHLLLILIILIQVKSKVKVVKTLTEIKNLLRGSEDFNQTTLTPPQEVTYITIMEGSDDVYASCSLICRDLNKQTLYSEITDFPGYGSIFRCQCGGDWSSWYNWGDMRELCTDILLGDSLFNDYMNLLGYDVDDCECDGLKKLLGKMVSNNLKVNLNNLK